MDQTDLVKKCAELIGQSRRVVFLTSAGMSADSNIPTFRDKEGYWTNFPPFREKGLEAQDLASPWAFRNELPHAWAFYEWRRRNAEENSPHAGYTIINRWIAERFEDAFIHTTNTDGYHLRSGCPPDKVKEVHGSMWRLQCLDVCTPDFWEEESVPLCDLDHATMKASNYPACRHCGGIARPHILMFGDGEYTGHEEQERNFYQFARQGGADLVILVGSSGAIPTNDYLALDFQAHGATIININLDASANSIVNTGYFLTMKGKEAFETLDQALNGP
ncbi:MAG: iron dicitrate transport regulator FecR [Nitrospinaceae bacterium]|nr:iron dicitrate transport regulator FecR [Nitrospinaceae bacterium]NIR55139.1 iron dicitrate transport regulator FecR [Nitrospinaceae bacterium]NIS85559.1 iron dicitrate transport regulator FecR [Nitrospinaceae bacterium]NIT82393.1 iron dicitrate transport regulator FecR [Nitrospinaceae bacterium]NIU44606.1 iron dicitrate transport regulator FecR [Nitrospinaceae bacterium]